MSQTFPTFLILIVSDYSMDGTEGLLWRRARSALLIIPANKGWCKKIFHGSTTNAKGPGRVKRSSVSVAHFPDFPANKDMSMFFRIQPRVPKSPGEYRSMFSSQEFTWQWKKLKALLDWSEPYRKLILDFCSTYVAVESPETAVRFSTSSTMFLVEWLLVPSSLRTIFLGKDQKDIHHLCYLRIGHLCLPQYMQET